MTNPLPESAVELAARDAVEKAMRRAFILGQNYWADADSESYAANKRADKHRADFAALLEQTLAALPAIREAVVGEFLRLADRWDVRADLEDMEGGPFFDESERDQLLACATEIRTLAALTEQENRNG